MTGAGTTRQEGGEGQMRTKVTKYSSGWLVEAGVIDWELGRTCVGKTGTGTSSLPRTQVTFWTREQNIPLNSSEGKLRRRYLGLGEMGFKAPEHQP